MTLLLDIRPESILLYGFLLIGYVVFYYFFVRYVFSIDRRTSLQEMQVKLLSEIAIKQGVSKEMVDDITSGL